MGAWGSLQELNCKHEYCAKVQYDTGLLHSAHACSLALATLQWNLRQPWLGWCVQNSGKTSSIRWMQNTEWRFRFLGLQNLLCLNSMVWVGNSWQFLVLCKIWKKIVKFFYFQVLMDLGVIIGADFKSASHFSAILQEIWFLMVIMVFSGRQAAALGEIKPHMDNFPLARSWCNLVWCTTNRSIKFVESNFWRWLGISHFIIGLVAKETM